MLINKVYFSVFTLLAFLIYSFGKISTFVSKNNLSVESFFELEVFRPIIVLFTISLILIIAALCLFLIYNEICFKLFCMGFVIFLLIPIPKLINSFYETILKLDYLLEITNPMISPLFVSITISILVIIIVKRNEDISN